MSEVSRIQDQDIANILASFIDQPPQGVPAEVLDALTLIVQNDNQALPPKLFFEVVEHLAVAISITNTQAEILYANPAFEEMTGYTAQELVGKNQSILSNSKTPIEVYQELWSALLGGRKWAGVLLNKRKDSQPYLADLTVAPVFNAAGEVTHYLGIHRDVTEMTALQKKVESQKAMIENVIDLAPVMIALLDENGKVVVENNAYKVLMGDMGGREPAHEFMAFMGGELGDSFEQLKQKKKNFDNVEIRVDVGVNMGTRWFSCSGTWIEVDDQPDRYFEEQRHRGLLLVCTENTKRMRLFEEAKTNAIKALMAEQQAVEGIREIVSGAIFQLQGPLNMVSAASEMMDRGVGDPSSLRGVLRQVQDAGKTALERLQACMPDSVGEPRMPVNPNEIVREILDVSFDRLLRENIVVSWKPTPVLPTITGRPNALRSMIKHLIDNGIDAINEPGATDRELTIVTRATDDDMIEIIIADTGPGMPADSVLKVFEPFYVGWTRRRKSAGMGLPIVQQVLNEHGGSLHISEGFHGGCKITLSLPVGPRESWDS